MDQHCWGCRKRRVVCDLTKPGCEKCKRAGVECPGYGKKKPLQWLEVGKVKSRENKRRSQVVVNTAIEIEEHEQRSVASPKTNASSPEVKERVLSNTHSHRPDVKVHVKVEAKEINLSNGSLSQLDIDAESPDIVQAYIYYNEVIYPELQRYHELSPSPWVAPVMLEELHSLPSAVRHTMVSSTLCYRIYRQELSGAIAWPKVLAHRGCAIQELNKDIEHYGLETSKEHITREQSRMVDILIKSVIVFVFVEIQYCASMEWRHHIEATSGMISSRGGLTKLWHESTFVRTSLVKFILIQNFGSSTSPVTSQTSLKPFNQLLSVPEEMHEDIFSNCLCPFQLFESIAFINRLRVQVAQDTTKPPESHNTAAKALTMRIDSSSTADWMGSHSSFAEELALVADIYHCAVMLYCILSLEHVLCSTLRLEELHEKYAGRLFQLLSRALSEQAPIPRIPYFIIWPVVVAGVEAARLGPEIQAVVDRYLTDMSRQCGNCSALVGQTALRNFWASGGIRWDECFSASYAFQC